MKIFIQARTSSKRLPGKVFKTLINKNHSLDLLIYKLSKLFSKKRIVILTSKNKSDDAIQKYCKKNKINYFRGSLKNVAGRFLEALKVYRCKYFMRVSADSPLLDMNIIKIFIKYIKSNKFDIITNVNPRTFPKGQSVEIVKSQTFIDNFKRFKSKKNFEHVTNFFYNFESNFKIKNIKYGKNLSKISLALDTKKDLLRIRKILNISKKVDTDFFKYVSIAKKL
ncbi:MAG: hypothetical protein CBC25_00120 [Pelagibacteraceae bacterium TMED65]|nr:MAG: hypothetical protein CBC25_00120 [Pelagibacteraceae bacterium TMED65]|tara:strand:+ start:20259 stop:20930 length:672 start_codon:yes stop_codon:yes gene_type:complete